jgi:hypothetical protein
VGSIPEEGSPAYSGGAPKPHSKARQGMHGQPQQWMGLAGDRGTWYLTEGGWWKRARPGWLAPREGGGVDASIRRNPQAMNSAIIISDT